MEPEVHLVDKYLQEIKHWFTMTNIQFEDKKEIELLAINPTTSERYHLEVGVWTVEKVTEAWLKGFQEDKFEPVKQRVEKLFGNVGYHKILVLWKVKDSQVIDFAKKQFDIEIWLIEKILHELQDAIFNKKIIGSRDDVLRIVELVSRWKEEAKEKTN